MADDPRDPCETVPIEAILTAVRANCASLSALEIARCIGAFVDDPAQVGLRPRQLAALWTILFEQAVREGIWHG
jgi:hypothetical protein